MTDGREVVPIHVLTQNTAGLLSDMSATIPISRRGAIVAALVPVNAEELMTLAADRKFGSDPKSLDWDTGPIRSISVRELAQQTSKYVRAVEVGESFAITRHGQLVALFTPLTLADIVRSASSSLWIDE